MKQNRSELVAEGYEAAIRLERLMQQYPLAFYKLWDRPSPRTSQRRAVQSLLRRGVKCGLLVGGNRSGKTESGAMVAAATAIGADDPGVQKWMKDNGLPEGSIQSRPGRVCCGSLTSNESIRVQRPKVEKFLPVGTVWKNRHGSGESVAHLPNGGTVLFKTIDQGARAWQADSWDLCWLDEDPESEGVWNEARMRLVDRKGRMLCTMTPLRGLTWIWDRFVHDPEFGSKTVWIHGQDNPFVPSDELEALLRSYGAHERAARERGEFTVLEGRVYAGWSRDLHVVSELPNLEHIDRYMSIDFGTRNPFCALMAYVDTKEDTIFIVDEHYKREWTLSRHAEKLKEMFKQWGEPSVVVADPEDRGSRLSLATDHDIQTVKAKKEIRAGINSVAERLQPDVEGRPHLFVHERCHNLI